MDITVSIGNHELNMAANKTNPAVSVIIPTYDRPDFIADAVASVKNQTYSVSEIIIIDDGSSSKFRRELKDIAIKHSSVKLHHLPSHKGVSYARNFGLSVALGDYVLFLDDDDTIHPLMIESALQILENNPTVDAVFCQYNFKYNIAMPPKALSLTLLFNYHQLKSVSFPFKPIDCFTAKQLASEPIYTILKSYIALHSGLLRRAAIGDTRFPEELAFGEDKCFWLSLAVNRCVFRMVAKPYATVGRHARNYSQNSRKGEKKKQLAYYETLERKKLLQCRKSRALTYLKLLHIRIVLGLPLRFSELPSILGSPDIIFGQLFLFCKRRLSLRWAFVRYYFSKSDSDGGVI